MAEHQVLVAGGGPTGMMLAAELKLAEIDVAIVERRPDPTLIEDRARGLHSRSIEVLDQRGIVKRFLSAGYTAQIAGFGAARLDMSDFPTRHPYGLALMQAPFERILADWIDKLGVTVYRNREFTGFTQDDTGVDLRLADGEPVRALFLVGCDGGRSVIRKSASISFNGTDASVSNLLAEVQFREPPETWGFHHDILGMHALSLNEDKKTMGIMLTEAQVGSDRDPTLADLQAALTKVYGTDFGIHSPSWISRFTDAARQAETYRRGRVLLAGDAAHIHYPAGGQGLNLGLQDAVNLGWKLAEVVKGTVPEALLDTYQAERYPVAAQVLKLTLAQVAMRRPDECSRALAETVTDLFKLDQPRKAMAGTMSGLAIRYDLGEGHPLLGRRMPDLDLVIDGKPVRMFDLLHEARAVLLRFAAPQLSEAAPWGDRIQLVDAAFDGSWSLPVIGPVAAPSAALVRPDGYVAWVGEGATTGLVEALTKWFGLTAWRLQR